MDLTSIKNFSLCGQQVARQSDLYNNYVWSIAYNLGIICPRSTYRSSLVNKPVEKFADSLGTYLFVHQVNIQSLQKPISSTVLITSDKQPDYCATGIIVKSNGKKYLLSSYHVIIDKLAKVVPDLYGVNTSCGLKKVIPLDEKALIGFVKPPYGDVAILKYEGNIEGVDLAETFEANCEHKSFAIGYPGCFKQYYSGPQINPMLSYGLAAIEGANSNLQIEDDFNTPLPTEYDHFNVSIPLDWIFYSGVMSNGNSGGGLFNLDGELIGIYFGSRSFTKPINPDNEIITGIIIQPAVFFSVKELLKSLSI